jgi:hypothetical protein
MVVSDESLLVDGERVRGVDVREAMLSWGDSLWGVRCTMYQVGRGCGCASEKDPLRWIVACMYSPR